MFYLTRANSMQFGRCYTFNADENKPLQTSAEGFNAYIHFTLDTEPDEYSDWWVMSAGIHVIIHNPGEKPEPSKNGYLLSPGFSHYISLKREEVKYVLFYNFCIWPSQQILLYNYSICFCLEANCQIVV